MSYATPALIALGRVLMSIMFIVEGFEKIPGYAGTQGYMEAHNVPGLLLPLVIAIELLASPHGTRNAKYRAG